MLQNAPKSEIEQKVHKHVAAIHCSGELTLFQRKVINCLLYHAYQDLPTKSRFKIHIRELLNLLGLCNNDYRYLREAFRNIRRTDITWNLTTEDFHDGGEQTEFEKWIDCSWLSWAMSDGSTIHYEFPEPLKAYLIEPSVYSSISLQIQRHFTSKFALILYENCQRYIKIGKTKSFDLDVFRNIMGVKEGQYKIFRDFNNRVLRPAIKQVNEKTDIEVEAIKKRAKRKVTEIQFTVEYKEKAETKKIVKPKNEIKINGVTKSLIEQKARPGETYEQAAHRIKSELSR